MPEKNAHHDTETRLERLRELAADENECDNVRQAASERLEGF